MKRFTLAALAALALASNAGASGDYGPSYTMFKAWTAPDIALERFQAGELGVIQPGMRRVYLYTAWRAIALGPKAGSMPGLAGGLARADGSVFAHGWTEDGDQPYGELLKRTAAVLRLPADDPQVRKVLACPPAATAYAMQVLRGAAARADATPARLDAWVLAQYRVGEACQGAEDARYRFGNDKPPALTPPAQPPANEPAYWRQLNEYQRAAWAFQGEHYADSTALFERIGATPGHPMRELGAYLALRSEVRRALAIEVPKVALAAREQEARILEKRGDAILADASLGAMHEPTRALLRSMRAGLTPESRLQELSRSLGDPARDPFAQDRLGDWSVVMEASVNGPLAKVAPPLQTLRKEHEFIDWIEALRDCAGLAARPSCPVAGAHALERWQQTRSRAWLVAALMLAESAPPALVQAGLALPASDPGYLTVRYHLARLLRQAGKGDEARAILDAILPGKLSPGTRNLFREERFAVARSVRDGGAWLLRTNVDYRKGDDKVQEDSINDDGLAWLNQGLPVADLVELAGQPGLPQPLRARIAGAAWVRAALLDAKEEGDRAGALLAQLAPATADAVARYGRAASGAERRHLVLAASLRFQLAAQLAMSAEPVAAPADPGELTASGWCSFKPGADKWVPGAEGAGPGLGWRLPPVPDTGHAAQARAEVGRLGTFKTATGTVGDDVMAWAASHPDDPELPWLLHVVVMSTRGGCLDADAKALSRKAWNLLHKRYARSEWAARTPYYY